jgi:hypothetical protein
VTLGHKLVRGPHRDSLLPAVHSLLSSTLRIRLSVFSDICALFHFLDHSYPVSFPQFAHSSAKNRGYTSAWSYHASSMSAVGCRLSASLRPLPLSPLFPLHTEFSLVSLLFSLLTQEQGYPHAKMSARRHFSFFPLFFVPFLLASCPSQKAAPTKARGRGKRRPYKRRHTSHDPCATRHFRVFHQSPVTNHQSTLLLSYGADTPQIRIERFPL